MAPGAGKTWLAGDVAQAGWRGREGSGRGRGVRLQQARSLFNQGGRGGYLFGWPGAGVMQQLPGELRHGLAQRRRQLLPGQLPGTVAGAQQGRLHGLVVAGQVRAASGGDAVALAAFGGLRLRPLLLLELGQQRVDRLISVA